MVRLKGVTIPVCFGRLWRAEYGHPRELRPLFLHTKSPTMKLLLCIALLCSTSSFCQTWIEHYDKFTKRTTWTTEECKIQGRNIVDKNYLVVHLLRDTSRIYGIFTFNTSFEYEYLASKDTHITFLYENDSTATVGVEYGKSMLMTGYYSGTFYSVYIGFNANYLKEPIKAIRMHLAEYNKDFDLKDEEITRLLIYFRKCTESIVK